MKKVLIALLSLGLLFSFGCDEPAEEVDQDEAELEIDEEVDEEAADEEAADEEAAYDEQEEKADEETEVAQAEDGVIEVTATSNSFEPSAIEAPSGESLQVKFTREAEDGCMNEVVFPGLDIEEELPVGETVTVEVTPDETEAIAFECGMGMGESTITGT